LLFKNINRILITYLSSYKQTSTRKNKNFGTLPKTNPYFPDACPQTDTYNLKTIGDIMTKAKNKISWIGTTLAFLKSG